MNKKLLILEITGPVFIFLGAWYMRSLYEICSGALAGILFGAVNKSIWEQCKTLLLPYLLWTAIEVMSLKLRFHRFVAVKTCGLYALGLSYIALRLFAAAELFSAAASLTVSIVLPFALYNSRFKFERFFAPAVTMLFLFLSLYFSLTPFPPSNKVFLDPVSGTYGIVTPGYDYGAVFLNQSLYAAALKQMPMENSAEQGGGRRNP